MVDYFENEFKDKLLNKNNNNYLPFPFNYPTGDRVSVNKTIGIKELLNIPVTELSIIYGKFYLLSNCGYWLKEAAYLSNNSSFYDEINNSQIFTDFLKVVEKIMGITVVNKLSFSYTNAFTFGIDQLGVGQFLSGPTGPTPTPAEDFKFGISRFGDRFIQPAVSIYTFNNIDYARILLARTYKFFSFPTFDNILGSVSALFGIPKTDIVMIKKDKKLIFKLLTQNLTRVRRIVIGRLMDTIGSDGELLYTLPTLYSGSIIFVNPAFGRSSL